MQPAWRNTGDAHNPGEREALEQELIDQLFGSIADAVLGWVGDKLAATDLALPFGFAASSVVTVEVAQWPDSQGGYGLAATITVDIPGMEEEQAQELANAAHAMCPYSKATHGNIDVEVTTRSHR